MQQKLLLRKISACAPHRNAIWGLARTKTALGAAIAAVTGLTGASGATRVGLVGKAAGIRWSSSSSRWTQRQSGDHYTREARVQNLKSRAAFKLLEMDSKYRLFKRGQTVVDLVSRCCRHIDCQATQRANIY